MARRVFFSFHYERDIWRANVVRNSWLTHSHREAAGFWDGSLWEDAQWKGHRALQNMIDSALYSTSVTVVLIGAETAQREYVQYEISASYQLGKGLLGIYIHNIADMSRTIDRKGRNPFHELADSSTGDRLSDLFTTYDWIDNGGYHNLGDWVEEAAREAARYRRQKI
jgi:hypothetical protein